MNKYLISYTDGKSNFVEKSIFYGDDEQHAESQLFDDAACSNVNLVSTVMLMRLVADETVIAEGTYAEICEAMPKILSGLQKLLPFCGDIPEGWGPCTEFSIKQGSEDFTGIVKKLYIGYWSDGAFVEELMQWIPDYAMQELVGEDSGYSEDDLQALDELAPGEIWKSPDYGDFHVIIRVL